MRCGLYLFNLTFFITIQMQIRINELNRLHGTVYGSASPRRTCCNVLLAEVIVVGLVRAHHDKLVIGDGSVGVQDGLGVHVDGGVTLDQTLGRLLLARCGHTGFTVDTQALQWTHRLYSGHTGFTVDTQALQWTHRLYSGHTGFTVDTQTLQYS